MFTGMDVFGTDVVALRHEGPLGKHVKTLAEVLGRRGYNTTCVGFQRQRRLARFPEVHRFQRVGIVRGRPKPQGGEPERGRDPRAQEACRRGKAVLPVPAAHGPALAVSSAGAVRADVLRWGRVRHVQPFARRGDDVQAVLRLLRELVPAALQGQGLHHRAVRRRGRVYGRVHRQHLRRP